MTADEPTRRTRPGSRNPRSLVLAAGWGAATALTAYLVGRGNVAAMVVVLVVIGVGQRAWAYWYHRRNR